MPPATQRPADLGRPKAQATRLVGDVDPADLADLERRFRNEDYGRGDLHYDYLPIRMSKNTLFSGRTRREDRELEGQVPSSGLMKTNKLIIDNR